ncbi:MAG: 50S ribosomal protein L6 [bacterium JZ-2024 1]
MSRVGKKPIPLPADVSLEIREGVLWVKGRNGTLTRKIPEGIEVHIGAKGVEVKVKPGLPNGKALHGTYRALIANMIRGVSEGFEEVLLISGPGYKATVVPGGLNFLVGHSHPVFVPFPEGIKGRVEENRLVLSGIDKEALGKFAAEVRAVRPPDPYRGHGIRYAYEEAVRKPKKAAKVGT